MRFTGKLLRDGQVVLDHASGDIWGKTMPDGLRIWGGHLDPKYSLESGGEFELLLDDGRRSPVSIDPDSLDRHHPTAISFRGSESLGWAKSRPTRASG